MSMTELKLSFPTEKLDALRFFMDKKQQTVEQELTNYLDKTYEKLVPPQVREYIESRMEQTPEQGQPEQAPARERSVRQSRRQRERAAAEAAPAPEAPIEEQEPGEEETHGMTMNM